MKKNKKIDFLILKKNDFRMPNKINTDHDAKKGLHLIVFTRLYSI